MGQGCPNPGSQEGQRERNPREAVLGVTWEPHWDPPDPASTQWVSGAMPEEGLVECQPWGLLRVCAHAEQKAHTQVGVPSWTAEWDLTLSKVALQHERPCPHGDPPLRFSSVWEETRGRRSHGTPTLESQEHGALV